VNGLYFHELSQLALVTLFLLPIAAFAATVLVTRPLIGWLTARQFGKTIRVDGPDHAAKAGTPTMGGIGMLAVIGVIGIGLTWSLRNSRWMDQAEVIVPLTAMAAFGLVGLFDDLASQARRSGKETGVGLTARKMLSLQITIAILITSLYLYLDGILSRVEQVPWYFGALAVLVIVGMVNGVNISDGLDGLAAGLLALAFGTVGFLSAFVPGYVAFSVPLKDLMNAEAWDFKPSIFIGALPLVAAAACLGFLAYNRHPARVFMGNVASMGLGGGLAAMSLGLLRSSQWPLLPVIGIVFIAEVASDIIQIGYFKWTGGQRFFRMAPLHHHFELGGMPETQVVKRFWAIGAVGSILAITYFLNMNF